MLGSSGGCCKRFSGPDTVAPLLVGLLLFLAIAVDLANSQDFLPCPDGYVHDYLVPQGNKYFKYILRENRFNYPEIVWARAINGSTNFVILKGKDNFLVRAADKSSFILRQACVTTKEIRNVFMTVFRANGTVFEEKIFQKTKGSYREVCLDVSPAEGIEIDKITFKFRTTKGKAEGTEEQNHFEVRNLAVSGCVPDYDV